MNITPLAARIIEWAETNITKSAILPPILALSGAPPILALSGAQGIGKSTAIAALAQHPRLRIATLSLDDVYLTHAARQALAREIHPLCATRGPPGSHDIALLLNTLSALQTATASSQTLLPRFDKRTDDRTAPTIFAGKPDAILLEGWMIGALPCTSAPTSPPINWLERGEDPYGTWRAWQEAALASTYAPLWPRTSAMLHLDAPGWAIVKTWRLEQEATTLGTAVTNLPQTRRQWVERFIMHFERITRRMLAHQRHPGERIAVDDNRQPV